LRNTRYASLAAREFGCPFKNEGIHGVADLIEQTGREEVEFIAVGVEAKDENAAAFYRLQGFRPFASRPMFLFLPLGTAIKGAAEENPR